MINISEEAIKAVSSSSIYKRGTEYYQSGRVHIKSIDEGQIKAVADDTQNYNVIVKISNNTVTDYFCTCPYYHTMGCSCKHIVATLKAYRNMDSDDFNDNDRIADILCEEYRKQNEEKKRVNLSFAFSISDTDDKCFCSISVKTGLSELSRVDRISNFLDSIYDKDKFVLSKHKRLNKDICILGEYEEKILDILCEVEENREGFSGSEMFLGEYTVKRVLPLLKYVDCEFRVNGIMCPDLRITEDNPDILVDVNVNGATVNLSVNERGTAVVRDGSWFLYEGNLYKTDEEWQKWFMPIYNTVIMSKRTQIDFTNNNAVNFITEILPQIEGKKGVVLSGFEQTVVNTKPEFEIYPDMTGNTLTVKLIVRYGSININIFSKNNPGDKILVRNTRLEEEIISFFDDFKRDEQGFTTDDDDVIFDFLSSRINILKTYAKVFFSRKNKILPAPVSVKTAYLWDVNLLEVGFESELSNEEVWGILSAVKAKKNFYRTKNGDFYTFADDDYSAIKVLSALNFGEGDIKNGKKLIGANNAFFISGLRDSGIIKTASSFDEFYKKLKDTDIDIPEALNRVLRDYQKDGVRWLAQLSEFGFGGILADDMGLGKTLQVIAFSMSVKRDKPVLVVTPSSLTYNWQKEIMKFAPWASSIIIEGAKEERSRLLENYMSYDFVITSYPLMRRDMELYQSKEFAFFFIDEAQYIKNPGTINAKSVKKINAGGYFALTGTPIENSLSELWSIFDFVMSGYLYSFRDFSKRYRDSIMKDEDKNAVVELKSRIKPFILRRMKKDVLKELPEKIEDTVYAGLEPEQKREYEAFLKAARNEVIYTDEKTASGRMRILTLLMRLRQICCHPKLFDSSFTKESGKLLLFYDLIDSSIEAGHRVLVFSQFTSMLSIIKEDFDEKGIRYFYIDGQTSNKERVELTHRFNKGEKDVFLISLKAGGTGLNLIGADTVIHYDPWWNPAVMDQASDRAYRIGQNKAVHIIKLATKGTIEEQIIKLQEKKRDLSDSIIKENQTLLSQLTKEEILEIFS